MKLDDLKIKYNKGDNKIVETSVRFILIHRIIISFQNESWRNRQEILIQIEQTPQGLTQGGKGT